MMLKNSPVIKGFKEKDISLLDAESRGQFFWGRPLEQRRRIFLAAKPGPEEIDHVLSCLTFYSSFRNEVKFTFWEKLVGKYLLLFCNQGRFFSHVS